MALASVIAQYLSALLIVLHLLRRGDECRLSWRKLRFHPQASRRVLAIGHSHRLAERHFRHRQPVCAGGRQLL